ncbi:hypothetical protein WJX74_006081 [Apatococcus lobatus]|uniref:DUF3119 family protein n=1 Tax=Apatococcus lobatus TaxID=904363 RepID=A0AAW1QC34_9CHLO
MSAGLSCSSLAGTKLSQQQAGHCSLHCWHHAARSQSCRSSRTSAAPVHAFFNFLKKKTPIAAPVVRPTVTPDRQFNIPIALGAATGLTLVGGKFIPAAALGILAAFLTYQTFNVKFRFDDSGLEVVLGKQEEETENAFVGGKNRWEFDSFTNWEFWWPSFPVLVYFKENQTQPEGQIHFFPSFSMASSCMM